MDFFYFELRKTLWWRKVQRTNSYLDKLKSDVDILTTLCLWFIFVGDNNRHTSTKGVSNKPVSY